MPLDSATWVRHTEADLKPTDPLTLAGIIPVPDDVMTAYMLKVERAYRQRRKARHDARVAYWTAYQLLPINVGEQLRRRRRKMPFALDSSKAPKVLAKLADEVNSIVPHAEFTVHYFYTDPVLTVEYRDLTGRAKSACLGIWDRGRIVHIADHPSTEPISWWARVRSCIGL